MPRVSVNGVHIQYSVQGQGEPLLLIQGLSAGRRDWFFQMRPFRKRFRVVAFDNRGAGRSGKPADFYDIAAMTADTVGLMDALGLESAHILGMSLGSLVAQDLAIRYPERVRKLVLVAPLVAGEGESSLSDALVKALDLPEPPSAGVAEYVANGFDAIDVFTRVTALSFNRPLASRVVVPLARIHARMTGPQGLKGQMYACATCETLADLHRIRARTLVLAGAGDRVIPPRCSELVASRIPGATLVQIEGGSHAMYLERPRVFNRQVLNFLEDKETRGRTKPRN